MADKPKKPRKIKDLKARLGRTIAPNTETGGAIPPPNLGGKGTVPPPNISAPPGMGKPSSLPAPAPFAKPSSFAPPQAKPSRPADPFAAAPAGTAQQQVRLVIDDSAVADSEVGRVKKGKGFILVGLGALIGIIIGGGAGSMFSSRRIYNSAVQDGTAVYELVQGASDKVNKAKTFVDAAVKSAKGAAGVKPKVDVQAIAELQKLEKPFSVNQFSTYNYKLMNQGTVQMLFDYANNVSDVWGRFGALYASTAGEARQKELKEAAEAVDGLANNMVGCLPMLVEKRLLCAMVYVAPIKDSNKVAVRQSLKSTRTVEKEVYAGQDLSSTPDNYVIITDTSKSIGVLGQRASEFGQYQADLLRLKAKTDATAKSQGMLEKKLEEVARLEEVFTL